MHESSDCMTRLRELLHTDIFHFDHFAGAAYRNASYSVPASVTLTSAQNGRPNHSTNQQNSIVYAEPDINRAQISSVEQNHYATPKDQNATPSGRNYYATPKEQKGLPSVVAEDGKGNTKSYEEPEFMIAPQSQSAIVSTNTKDANSYEEVKTVDGNEVNTPAGTSSHTNFEDAPGETDESAGPRYQVPSSTAALPVNKGEQPNAQASKAEDSYNVLAHPEHLSISGGEQPDNYGHLQATTPTNEAYQLLDRGRDAKIKLLH